MARRIDTRNHNRPRPYLAVWLTLGALVFQCLAPAASLACGKPPRTYEAALLAFLNRSEGTEGVARVETLLSQLADELTAGDRMVAGELVPPAHLETWFFQGAGFKGVAASRDLTRQPLVSEALASRRATCLPLAAAYMALAERSGTEAIPMATPRHVFIRQEIPGGSINIELLDGGRQHPDGYYLHQENAPLDDPRAAQLLRPLSPSGLLAYLLNNHAVALRASGNVKTANQAFEDALDLDPKCQPCLYNYGNLLAAREQTKKALAMYNKALELHPWDEEALRNRAALAGDLDPAQPTEVGSSLK